MTLVEIKKYLYQLMVKSGMGTTDTDTFIEQCINMGLSDFWTADAWKFRWKSTTLAISGSASEYSLPDDFAVLCSIREKDSIVGKKLLPYSKEDFDLEFPKPSAFSSGTPQAFAVYDSGGLHKITFFPVSDAITLYIDYLTAPPQSVNFIPDEFLSGFMAAIERYLYPIDSEKRATAMMFYQAELKRLKGKLGYIASLPDYMPDDTQTQIAGGLPWAE